MIDLHCHVLPGIDDGPETIEGSLELARAAVATGTRVLLATPHVSWCYPNDAETIASLVDELNARLTSEGIAIDAPADRPRARRTPAPAPRWGPVAAGGASLRPDDHGP